MPRWVIAAIGGVVAVVWIAFVSLILYALWLGIGWLKTHQ